MIYPNNFEQKIGFNQIRELLKDLCISDLGIQYVNKIRFVSKPDVIHRMLDQVHEFVEILTVGKSFPGHDFFDLRDELQRVKTPGSYIEQEALFDLKTSLRTIQEILIYFKNSDTNKYTELKELTGQIEFPSEILLKAENIIDDKGDIRNHASSRLAEIRKEILQKQKKVNRETKKAFEQEITYLSNQLSFLISNKIFSPKKVLQIITNQKYKKEKFRDIKQKQT